MESGRVGGKTGVERKVEKVTVSSALRRVSCWTTGAALDQDSNAPATFSKKSVAPPAVSLD